jgi:hypothetical protein
MRRSDIHRLFTAPEILVVDLADAALRALVRALILEHPALDGEPPVDETPVRRRARALLHPARRLRRALAAYRREVDALVDDLQRDDLPF